MICSKCGSSPRDLPEDVSQGAYGVFCPRCPERCVTGYESIDIARAHWDTLYGTSLLYLHNRVEELKEALVPCCVVVYAPPGKTLIGNETIDNMELGKRIGHYVCQSIKDGEVPGVVLPAILGPSQWSVKLVTPEGEENVKVIQGEPTIIRPEEVPGEPSTARSSSADRPG